MLFTISVGNTNAQFNIKKKPLEKVDFINTSVHVLSKELTAKQIKHNKKRDLLNAVKARYDFENEFLKEAIKDYWYLQNITGELSNEEIEKKLISGDVIWYIALNNHTDRFFDRKGHKRKYCYYYFSHYELSLVKNKKVVISIPLVNNQLSELNMQFALNSMQTMMSEAWAYNSFRQYAKEINSNAKEISGKTLLVSESLTGYSQEYLQQFYQGQVKISSEKEILQAINHKDGRYAYLTVTVNDYLSKPSFNHIILDCASNRPLLVYRNANASSQFFKHIPRMNPHNKRLEFLSGNDFKKYQKIINS
jgi:hypothetical protein